MHGMQNKYYKNELKALLYCLQFSSTVGAQDGFRKICEDGIDWQEFIRLVRWHKLTPSVYNKLNRHYAAFVPNTVLADLKSHCNKNTLLVMKLSSELLRIGKLFQKENIPFISFKGPLLAQRVYGDLTLREPRDLDLLIPEAYFEVTHKLLLSQGYQLHLPKKLPKYLSLYRYYQKDFGYFHPERQIVLELHWRLFNNHHDFIFPIDQLFDDPEKLCLLGFAFVKMPTEIELLYLLHHGATHSWARLCWLYDIKQYLDQISSVDWSNLLEMAKKIKADRSLLAGLALIDQLFGVSLDPVIYNHIYQNSAVKKIAKTSYFVIKKARPPTLLMRLRMLKSRFRLRAWSVAFYKEFITRFFLRFFRVLY